VPPRLTCGRPQPAGGGRPARLRTRNSPAWLEAQYNNRARVPAHAGHFARWQQASALVRSSTSARLDVAYGPGAGETLGVFPAAQPGPPVLVFIRAALRSGGPRATIGAMKCLHSS